jgi:tetratricopeptide (TPR) repeat protein
MFRKNFFRAIVLASLFITGSTFAAAQTAGVSGKVELRKADGTKVPLAGATVEVFRTDIKASLFSAKTNKKGEFAFAGLPYNGTFVFSVSAPGAAPGYLPNVKAGMDKIGVVLNEGDGKRFTEDEVRQALANGGGTTTTDVPAEPTEDEKKAKAEYEKQVAQVTAKNEDTKAKNAAIAQNLKEGNEAYNAKNYDLAIAKYDAGIAADPEFAGSAPVLINNKSAALRLRAIGRYNEAVKLTDATAKREAMEKVRADFTEAAKGYNHSWSILQKAQPGDVSDPNALAAAKTNTLTGAKDLYRIVVQTEQLDPAMVDIATTLLTQYINTETDAAKKAEGRLALADTYRVAADSDKAIAAYKEILATSPDNIDALAGAGLSLVNLGYMNNDKAAMQEGANYLQKFASAAPDTHKYKADALALIDSLKKEQNVTPQKSAGGKKKN